MRGKALGGRRGPPGKKTGRRIFPQIRRPPDAIGPVTRYILQPRPGSASAFTATLCTWFVLLSTLRR